MVALPVLQPRPAPATPPRSVRLSLTDRCDLACIYCRPDKRDGYLEDRLEIEAWKTMAAGLVRAGVRRVRLTGGEPLLHPAVVEVVAFLGSLGLDDLALTTNATRLARHARALRDAGLMRVNVSLDTLDADRFRRMTRGGKLDVVLRGIDAALAAGFDEIKLNAVVVRGENDDEIEGIVRWSWERGIVPRFLEVMHIGEGAKLKDRVVRASEMRARLAHLVHHQTEAIGEADRGPAKYLFARHDPAKKVGFITGTSDTYCKGCDRLRVAADGTLRPCLATNDGLAAGHIARGGDASEIAGAVHDAWKLKPDGEVWKGCTEPDAAAVSMRGIGG
ncbi:MAG: cyclic pyranopterin phosphate synthase MoaA [Myxococcales bacterium 68-20]|nr:GTP 3',8-cyclase MoaA [Myxococcales bacterium]OJY23002.1 MAG: cyclic pyranopterin phosphate synthase MoaA [Myxococcales bacterium 68-20]